MQWNASYQESVFTFANNINTHEGGTHLSGLQRRPDAHAQPLRARPGRCSRRRRTTSRARTSARASPRSSRSSCQNPQFEGQTKTKLGNPGIARPRRADRQRAARGVPRGEPARREAIVMKAIQAARARQAARKARDLTRRKSALQRRVAAGQARRLPDRDPESRSSSSSRATRPAAPPRQARDRRYQAILPLRGKIINSEKNRINKVLSNAEIQAIDHRDRHGHRRRVRPREAPLPPDHRDDRRRRRRRAHPHADPDVPLPAHAGAVRARPRLHRRAAALPGQARQPGDYLEKDAAARGAARPRARSPTSTSPTATARA